MRSEHDKHGAVCYVRDDVDRLFHVAAIVMLMSAIFSSLRMQSFCLSSPHTTHKCVSVSVSPQCLVACAAVHSAGGEVQAAGACDAHRHESRLPVRAHSLILWRHPPRHGAHADLSKASTLFGIHAPLQPAISWGSLLCICQWTVFISREASQQGSALCQDLGFRVWMFF